MVDLPADHDDESHREEREREREEREKAKTRGDRCPVPEVFFFRAGIPEWQDQPVIQSNPGDMLKKTSRGTRASRRSRVAVASRLACD